MIIIQTSSSPESPTTNSKTGESSSSKGLHDNPKTFSKGGSRTSQGSSSSSPSMPSSSSGVRVIRPHPKDWVQFDSSDEDETVKNIEVDHLSNRLNLQLDMSTFESVEINFVKKKRHQAFQRTKILTSEVLIKNLEILRSCGFYYEMGDYDGEMCSKLLSRTDPGTFLIRDSSDSNYLFTLSLQTDRGPTSVRLVYFEGEFRLDAADQRLIGALPGFPNVVQLVQYYVDENNSKKQGTERTKSGSLGHRQVWIDSTTGRTHSVVRLTTPLRHQVPTLKHLSRLALNKLNRCDISPSLPKRNSVSNFSSKKTQSRVNLPESVKKYLQSYPFTL